MAEHNGERISHFNGGGKTFFFNKRKAKNDIEYLTLNAMYGSPPRYEKLVLFPQHYLEFLQHLQEAIEGLTGYRKIEVCPNCSPSVQEASVVSLETEVT